jgi:hypothetical protein
MPVRRRGPGGSTPVLMLSKRSASGRAGWRGSREAVAAWHRDALQESDPRAGAAPMGQDPEQPRQCALEARRAGGRDGGSRTPSSPRDAALTDIVATSMYALSHGPEPIQELCTILFRDFGSERLDVSSR